MALYNVTFRDGTVQYVVAARVTKFRNMGLWIFIAADDTLIEAFPERKTSTTTVALDEEPLVPRPAMRSGLLMRRLRTATICMVRQPDGHEIGIHAQTSLDRLRRMVSVH